MKYDNHFRHFMAKERNAAANAYASGDPAPVGDMSAKKGTATFFGPGGGLVIGAEKVNRTNARGAKRFGPGGRSQFKVAQLAADGELAFWSGIQSARVRLAGQQGKIPMRLRVTEVFRREKGAWKLIHRHADMLTKAAPKNSG